MNKILKNCFLINVIPNDFNLFYNTNNILAISNIFIEAVKKLFDKIVFENLIILPSFILI